MVFPKSDGDILKASDLDEFSCSSITSDGGDIVADTIECDSVDIGGGEIDNTPIGANDPESVKATSLEADGGVALKFKVLSTIISSVGSGTVNIPHGVGSNVRGLSLSVGGGDGNETIALGTPPNDSTNVYINWTRPSTVANLTIYVTVIYV